MWIAEELLNRPEKAVRLYLFFCNQSYKMLVVDDRERDVLKHDIYIQREFMIPMERIV